MIASLTLVAPFVRLMQNAELRVGAFPSFELALAQKANPSFGMTPEPDLSKQVRAHALLAQELARYPVLPLALRLDNVFVVNQLWFDQTYYGGTSGEDRRSFVLAVGTSPTINERWMIYAIHHEFAHLLQFKNDKKFPHKEWRRVNPKGFHYLEGDGYAALKAKKDGKEFAPDINAQGFVCEYAMASFEEDFACLAEEVLADNPDFWALVDKYPKLREKTRLVVEFYRKIMPGIKLREIG